MRFVIFVTSAILTLSLSATANAFCGFYVAKADTRLFNHASQVVLVRDGDRTVLTMANDFEGDVEDFAMVIPVPTFIERDQINVADKALIDHLDAYTSPRLVEYFDRDPCVPEIRELEVTAARSDAAGRRGAALAGVTIEASYTVGEYDILILSGEESSGLIRWLNENGYSIPEGADNVVGSYIRQGMRFFVAKVNLEAQRATGASYLRPIQVAYEHDRFMLPIRLGTLNADGAQDLYVYALTRTGRVETTNYRTARLPSNFDVPGFVEEEFGDFYRAMFARQVEVENRRAVFLEYAWDMAWCDPCAADPLSADELRRLGVFWVGDRGGERRALPSQAEDVFVTRLHVRYDAEHFPEDLMFQETGDRQNFQGRYVIRHPFTGDSAGSCDLGRYRAELRERREREAQKVANVTGWDIADIRAKMPALAGTEPAPEPWWRRLWN